LRPLWIISHLFVLALAVVLVNLGFWQLGRLDERQSRNVEVAARLEFAEAPFATVATPAAAIDDIEYRPVVASGTFAATGELLVDNRSLNGRPGAWAITPLELADGTIVAVNRGFVGVGKTGRVVPPKPPTGTVEVIGSVARFASRTCPSRTDDAGTVVGSSCLSRGIIEELVGMPVAPAVLQQARSVPEGDSFLSAVPLPEPGDGPHLGYAFQWFIFGSVAMIGYPLILRKNARERAVADGASTDPDDELRLLVGDDGQATID
jgi:cytochrome oxidase assembly protein ShyY1